MWYLKACRACLSTEGKLERIDEKAKRTFYNATEIMVEPGDGLPQYFCAECYTHIRKTMAFRRRSRRAFYVLKEIMMLMKQVTQNDILQVDRKKTNLVSPLAIWNPENNNSTFYFNAAEDDENEIKNEIDIKDEPIKSEFDTTNKENSVVEANLMVRSAEKTDVLRTYISKALTIEKTESQFETTHQSQSNIEEQNAIENLNTEEKVNIEYLILEEPRIVKNSAIVVDIKPDNWMELEREAAEKREREIEQVLREIVGEDGVDNDAGHFDDDNNADCEEEPAQVVDMEDIFKGLEEKPDESDFEWPDSGPNYSQPTPQEEVVEDKKNKKALNRKALRALWAKKKVQRAMVVTKPKGIDMKLMVQALTAASIRCLNPEQQSAAHQAYMKLEPFRSARFKCTMCVSAFNTMDQIQEHVEYHNGKKSYTHRCKVCMDVFITEEHLNKHCADRHWYEYQCGACDTKHTTLIDLLLCWKKNRKATEDLLMASCSWDFKDLSSMYKIRPLKQDQMGETIKRWTDENSGGILLCGPRGKYHCVKCKLILGSSIKYVEHMDMHKPSDKKRFTCDVCDISMSKRRALERHIMWRHLYSYKCRKCANTFYNRNQAFFHFNRCPKKKREQKRFYCNMCTFYTLGNEQGLLYHQLAQHGYIRLPKERRLHPDPNLYCEQCDIYFTHKNYLAAHAAREGHKLTDIHGTDVICLECGEAMESAAQLEEHKLDKHPVAINKRTRSQCNKCDIEFDNQWQLRDHMEAEHEFKDERMCDVCGRIMLRSAFFKHRSMHTVRGEMGMDEPLTCRFCLYKMFTKAQYISHMLCNHTMKPYCCTVCGSRYQTRTDARDHILKNHAPALPYTCEACDRHFAHLDYLHQHCLKMHGLSIKGTDKSVYLPKRMAGKIFTYEHLKIDGSLIEQNILSTAQIERCDYMDENNVTIPYTDAFFFDPTINPNIPTKFDTPSNNNKRPKVQNDEIAQPVKKKSKSKLVKFDKTQLNHSKITAKKEKLTNLTINSPMNIPKITIKKEKLQKFNHEVKIEKLPQYDAFGHIISDTQDSNDSKPWKIDLSPKSEEPDMPSLDIGEFDQNIPEFNEEEIVESKIEKKEDVIEEQTDFVEDLDPLEEKTEKEETPAFLQLHVQQPNEEGNSQQSGEETVLTEDVIGELVEHEGQYYVMVDGLLYTIQN